REVFDRQRRGLARLEVQPPHEQRRESRELARVSGKRFVFEQWPGNLDREKPPAVTPEPLALQLARGIEIHASAVALAIAAARGLRAAAVDDQTEIGFFMRMRHRLEMRCERGGTAVHAIDAARVQLRSMK